MKAFSIIALALLGTGCASPSRFVNDPRARVVGPDYLDTIAQNPRDRDTQFYYPSFTAGGITNGVDSYDSLSKDLELEFKPLLTEIPQPTEAVKKITGKGWARLERVGIPF